MNLILEFFAGIGLGVTLRYSTEVVLARFRFKRVLKKVLTGTKKTNIHTTAPKGKFKKMLQIQYKNGPLAN